MSDIEQLAQAFAAPIATRHRAAEVLQQVAKDVAWGSFPEDITPEQLGEAVSRALVNWQGGDLSKAFALMCVGYWKNRTP